MVKLLIILYIFFAATLTFAREQVTLTTIAPITGTLRGEFVAIGDTYKEETVSVSDNYLVVEEKVGIGTTNPEGCFEVIGDNGNPGDQDTRFGIGGQYEDIWFESLDDNEFYLTNVWNGDNKSFYTTFRPSDLMVFNFREWFGSYTGSRVGIMDESPDRTFDVNGSAGGTGAWYDASDASLKQNIQSIPNALDRIASLQGVSFEWCREEFPEMNFSEGRRLGLTAQNLEKVFPELVDKLGDTKEYKSISYNGLIAPVIEAIKELKVGDEELKAEVEKLKARL